jgi:C4-dicarboxylate transporter
MDIVSLFASQTICHHGGSRALYVFWLADTAIAMIAIHYLMKSQRPVFNLMASRFHVMVTLLVAGLAFRMGLEPYVFIGHPLRNIMFYDLSGLSVEIVLLVLMFKEVFRLNRKR